VQNRIASPACAQPALPSPAIPLPAMPSPVSPQFVQMQFGTVDSLARAVRSEIPAPEAVATISNDPGPKEIPLPVSAQPEPTGFENGSLYG
jgi:hypothetical protein